MPPKPRVRSSQAEYQKARRRLLHDPYFTSEKETNGLKELAEGYAQNFNGWPLIKIHAAMSHRAALGLAKRGAKVALRADSSASLRRPGLDSIWAFNPHSPSIDFTNILRMTERFVPPSAVRAPPLTMRQESV